MPDGRDPSDISPLISFATPWRRRLPLTARRQFGAALKPFRTLFYTHPGKREEIFCRSGLKIAACGSITDLKGDETPHTGLPGPFKTQGFAMNPTNGKENDHVTGNQHQHRLAERAA